MWLSSKVLARHVQGAEFEPQQHSEKEVGKGRTGVGRAGNILRSRTLAYV